MSTATGNTTPKGTARPRTAADTPGRKRSSPKRPEPRHAAGRPPAPAKQSAARAPRMPFVLLVLGLLSGALISLLALRSVLIEDAFTISTLQQENKELSNKEEALREEVLGLESPDRIAQEAEDLGMEPGEAPLFIDLETGEVIGEQPSAGTR
ncbi:MAG: hypothetical protein M0026_08640 [Nocardiopsaceae bacterium]|nr:hypothetical protein [Nocardiopsaceae bacterium]